jgi:flagellar export protein FliJ
MPDVPFRLASVLALRESQLTEALQKVSRYETEAHHLEDRLEAISRERDATFARTTTSGELDAADLRLASQYLDALDHQALAIQHQVGLVKGQLAEARTLVIERHQAVDILTRLKERIEATVQQDERRVEQRHLDEVAAQRAEQGRRKQRRAP